MVVMLLLLLAMLLALVQGRTRLEDSSQVWRDGWGYQQIQC